MDELSEKISKIVKLHGAELYDIETLKENGHTIFRVYVTDRDGIDLDRCADISRDISPLLDVYPPVVGHYNLEVSSPGIERKLKKIEHFKLAMGENIQIKLRDKTKVEGILLDADRERVVLKTRYGIEEYSSSDIDSAKTIFEWDT